MKVTPTLTLSKNKSNPKHDKGILVSWVENKYSEYTQRSVLEGGGERCEVIMKEGGEMWGYYEGGNSVLQNKATRGDKEFSKRKVQISQARISRESNPFGISWHGVTVGLYILRWDLFEGEPSLQICTYTRHPGDSDVYFLAAQGDRIYIPDTPKR